jgi:hypothetical protein
VRYVLVASRVKEIHRPGERWQASIVAGNQEHAASQTHDPLRSHEAVGDPRRQRRLDDQWSVRDEPAHRLLGLGDRDDLSFMQVIKTHVDIMHE